MTSHAQPASESSRKIAEAYWWQMQSGAFRVRHRNLAKAFFSAVGSIDPHESTVQGVSLDDPGIALATFAQKVLGFSLSVAAQIADPSQRIPYWRALGITTEAEWLASTAALLFLYPGSPVLGHGCKPFDRLLQAYLGHSSAVTALAFDREAHRLLGGAVDGWSRCWETKSGMELEDREDSPAAIQALAFDTKGPAIRVWSDGGRGLWGAIGAGEPVLLEAPGLGTAAITALALSADGSRLAIAWEDGRMGYASLKAWPRLTGWREVPPSTAVLETLAWGPQGALVAGTSADGQLWLWPNAAAGGLQSLGRPGGSITALAFSADGKRLALAGDEGRTRIYAFDKNSRIGPPELTLAGWGMEVTALAFHPKTDTLASAGPDGVVLLWDAVLGHRTRKNWIERSRSEMLRIGRERLLQTNAGHWLLADDPASTPHRNLVAKVSHLFRESMLFALLTRKRPDLIDGIRLAMGQIPLTGNIEQGEPDASDDCAALFRKLLRSLFRALHNDLIKIAEREGWPSQDRAFQSAAATEPGENSLQTTLQGEGDNEEERDRDDTGTEEDRDEKGDDEDQIEEAGSWVPDDSKGMTLSGQEYGRASISVREHVHRYLPLLQEIGAMIEGSNERFVSCGGVRCSMKDFSRLRFAAQLFSYLTEQRFPTRERERMIQALRLLFDASDGLIPAAAFEAFSHCRANERWGSSHDKALDVLVNKALASLASGTTACQILRERLRQRIEEGIERLNQGRAGPLVSPLPVKRIEQAWERLCELLSQERPMVLAAAAGQSEKARGLAELVALKGNLIQWLLSDPMELLSLLTDQFSAVLGKKGRIGDLTPTDLETAARQVRDRLAEIGDKGRDLDRKGPDYQRLQSQLAEGWCLVRIIEAIKQQLACQPLTEEDPGGEKAIDPERIIGFFTQMYSPTQEAGKKTWLPDEWLYLAYRLAFDGGVPAYRAIYERIARDSPLPTTGNLNRLYAFISLHEDLLEDLLGRLQRCIQLTEEGSP